MLTDMELMKAGALYENDTSDRTCRRVIKSKTDFGLWYPVIHKARGSITIEAAMVLPLFLFGCFFIMELFNLFSFYMGVERAIDIEAKKLSKKAFEGLEYTEETVSYEVKEILKENFTSFPVEDGEAGLSFAGSELSDREILRLRVDYTFKPVFDFFNAAGISISQECVMHTWIGYENGLSGEAGDDSGEVYVAQNGEVFHMSIMCSHIRLSITETDPGTVESLRNSSGGRYRACEQCHPDDSDTVLYIAANGDRYHNSLGCSGLKRTIQCMTLREALSKGLRPCSRCSGGSL